MPRLYAFLSSHPYIPALSANDVPHREMRLFLFSFRVLDGK